MKTTEKKPKTLSERSKSLGIFATAMVCLEAFTVGINAGMWRNGGWWCVWYFVMVANILIQAYCAVSSLIRSGRVSFIEEVLLGGKIVIKAETLENESEGGDSDGTEC